MVDTFRPSSFKLECPGGLSAVWSPNRSNVLELGFISYFPKLERSNQFSATLIINIPSWKVCLHQWIWLFFQIQTFVSDEREVIFRHSSRGHVSHISHPRLFDLTHVPRTSLIVSDRTWSYQRFARLAQCFSAPPSRLPDFPSFHLGSQR